MILELNYTMRLVMPRRLKRLKGVIQATTAKDQWLRNSTTFSIRYMVCRPLWMLYGNQCHDTNHFRLNSPQEFELLKSKQIKWHLLHRYV